MRTCASPASGAAACSARPGREPGGQLVRRAPRPGVRRLAGPVRHRLRPAAPRGHRVRRPRRRRRHPHPLGRLDRPADAVRRDRNRRRGAPGGRGEPRDLDAVLVRQHPLHPGPGHPPRGEQHQQRGRRQPRAGVPVGRARRSLPLVRRVRAAGGRPRSRRRRPAATRRRRRATCSPCSSVSRTSPTRSRGRRPGSASGSRSCSRCGGCSPGTGWAGCC